METPRNELHAEEMLRRIIAIDHRTESMSDGMHWLVRSGGTLKDTMVAAFGKSRRRVQVYLALDGLRSGVKIGSALKIKQPNVAREINWLKEKRLIEVSEAKGNEIIYRKQSVDHVIGLSATLMRNFALDHRGRPRK